MIYFTPMDKYELTIVLDGKSTPAKRKTVISTIEKIITTFKGKIEKTEDWGEREIYEKSGKNNSGYFVHFLLEFESSSIKGLNLKLKMENEIKKHLLIRI